ncbi:MAG TPA: hypothetical protein PLE30_11465 [Candidatus Kapabacteria bacterium]|nr:hypothetical protein [Candidatus Kapabacteria bacterium]
MKNKEILGCFVSSMMNDTNGDLFRNYIWGQKGIYTILKQLNQGNYGNDLIIILFQFYVNPLQEKRERLKEIESYRKNEKSIGIPIIIDNENFFCKSEEEKYNFLLNTILSKLLLLKNVVIRRKLDTKIDNLIQDIHILVDKNIKLLY